MSDARFPTLFISHGGGPWPYIDEMRRKFARTEAALRALPQALPSRPHAVVVVTGHWERPMFTVSTAAQPPMVYDYSGFPEHTYHIRYPAPGAPSVAHRIRTLLNQSDLPCAEDDTRGFDHGTFVPLYLMYPDADVPVVMVSLKSGYDPGEHLRLGQALAPLRDEGILIMGSGLTYHNMRGFGRPEAGPVSRQFEDYLFRAVSADPALRERMLIDWQAAPAARQAHPREDHLLPLMVAAGAAGSDTGTRLFEDHVFEVEMASYRFG